MTTQELYEKFSVVLIYEHLDESLVLMKRRLCWQLDDILYLKFHYTNHDQWNRNEVSDLLAQKIRKWNEADVFLYDFFNKTLWKEINYEGESFWKELKEFKANQQAIENDCVQSESVKFDEKFSLSELPTTKKMINESKTIVELNYQGEEYRNRNNNNKEAPRNRSLRELLVNSKIFKNKVPDKDKKTPSQKHYLKSVGEGEESFNSDQIINIDDNNNLVGTERGYIKDKTIRTSTSNDGNLYTENNILIGSGTGKPMSKDITNIDRMLSKTATSWNKYMCKKLLMTELEYLDYFRRKHAYGKAAQRK